MRKMLFDPFAASSSRTREKKVSSMYWSSGIQIRKYLLSYLAHCRAQRVMQTSLSFCQRSID